MRGSAPGVVALCLIGWAAAEVPQFCADVNCKVYLQGLKRQRVYVQCDVPTQLMIYNSESVPELPVTIAVPVGVQGHTHTVHTGNIALSSTESLDVFYDPYYHIARTDVQEGIIQNMGSNEEFILNFGDNIGHNASVFLITLGNRYEPTLFELVQMPSTQFRLHGQYWSRTSHWYVFALTTGLLALLYGAFSRARIWQYAALLSVGAFVAVFAAQLHQILLIVLASGQPSYFYQGLFANALAANLVPTLFALLFMHTAKTQPMPWSILALVVGAGSFFLLGAGWYVGPSLLVLAALIRLTDRFVLSTVAVVR